MTDYISTQPEWLPTDSLAALKSDIRFIRKTRGALRLDLFVRAHFYNRLMALRTRSPQ